MVWTRLNDLLVSFIEFLDKYKEIDYSFIPNNWNKVEGDVVTTKTMQNNIPVSWDVRDLFNSTVYSRRWADDIIKETERELFGTRDQYFLNLCLNAANKVILDIKYKTNKSQFNVSDRWNNGDTAIVTGAGDCDINSRVFIRVMNDVLDKLKMYEYKKMVFQMIGIYGLSAKSAIGHSWVEIYSPIDKKFKLIECTSDTIYASLKSVPHYYDKWFCLNYKHIFFQNPAWRSFL